MPKHVPHAEVPSQKRQKRDGNTVALAHARLKAMIIEFDLRPGERLNEMHLSEQLDVGRTPLREAINRLLVERLVEFVPNRGFFIRQVDVKEIEDLFEARGIVEVGAVRLVVERASAFDLESLSDYWQQVLDNYGESDADYLVKQDALFHERLAALSGNSALLDTVRDINSRIHFVRWADLHGVDRKRTFEEHEAILSAIAARDADRAAAEMFSHVTHRSGGLRRAIADGLLMGLSRPANVAHHAPLSGSGGGDDE
ncbi:GntR family transcriptional regulator [Rhodovulum sp. 12E13]|nr:GntR family transcriptional regulator [Rhodovulum sp. 12E13]